MRPRGESRPVVTLNDYANASPIPKQMNGEWPNLLYNSTPLYLKMFFLGMCGSCSVTLALNLDGSSF